MGKLENNFAKIRERRNKERVPSTVRNVNKVNVRKKPTANVFYPTITAEDGKSTSAGVKNLKYTSYSYNISEEESQVQNMLFTGNNYWLASRCGSANSSYASFIVRVMASSFGRVGVYASYLCGGDSSSLAENTSSLYAVRPLVSLKSEVIDIDAGYNEATGGWKLK